MSGETMYTGRKQIVIPVVGWCGFKAYVTPWVEEEREPLTQQTHPRTPALDLRCSCAMPQELLQGTSSSITKPIHAGSKVNPDGRPERKRRYRVMGPSFKYGYCTYVVDYSRRIRGKAPKDRTRPSRHTSCSSSRPRCTRRICTSIKRFFSSQLLRRSQGK